jgi:hypothetical protein
VIALADVLADLYGFVWRGETVRTYRQDDSSLSSLILATATVPYSAAAAISTFRMALKHASQRIRAERAFAAIGHKRNDG